MNVASPTSAGRVAAAAPGEAHVPAPGLADRPGAVWIPGGTFWMGSDRHYAEERPAHRVRVSGFWMDTHAVTNRQFEAFVAATGYVTVAERVPEAGQYPGAPPELLVPGSTVFVSSHGPVPLDDPYRWWAWVPGADWRHPQGADSGVEDRWEHPVLHVAWEDAVAYAAWAGKVLPSEAEWEFAARGGLDGAEFTWGEELTPGGRWTANVWQGRFPYENTLEDGFVGTAPVGSFPANRYGLFDMIGNVWEWTADWYSEHQRSPRSCCAVDNPRGGTAEGSAEPGQVAGPRKVMKGGSHLCAPNYCQRYRPAARMGQAVDTGTSHLGFRLVVRSSS